MKKIIAAAFVFMLLSCVSDNEKSERVRPTRNVILMIPDGTSTSLLSLSKWYGRYMGDKDFELNLKDHICGLMSSTMSDGVIPCSAPAMSGIVTGMPQRAGNISIYPSQHQGQDLIDVDPQMAYQPLATVMEAARLLNDASTGLVATVEYYHATPAACMSHAYSRGDVTSITRQMASNYLDLVFASGAGSVDETISEIFEENDVVFLKDDMEGFRKYADTRPVWALFGEEQMTFDVDRDTSSVPSLAEMTSKAIEILSKDKNGFFLMVEGSKVDFAAHANDPYGTITEFLAFDEAVGVAMDFAEKDGNTTVVVVPDHGNSGITAGDPGYKGYVHKGIDSIYVDMKNFKATYSKLGRLLADCRKEDVRPLFKEWTGIDLTEDDLRLIIETAGIKENDYMKVADSRNLESVIASVLTSYTHLTFANSNHTPEDVFLAVYHPEGDIPKGILTNTELNSYLCKVAGLKIPLSEVTQEYFARHDSLLEGYSYEVIKDKDNPRLVIDSEAGEVVVPAWRSVISVAGKDYRLPVASVYMEKNGIFYIPRQILQVL